MINTPITVAFSPCPNDTYIFDALVHHRLPLFDDLNIDPVLADVEALNRAAADGRYPVTKLSIAALGHLAGRYRLLDSGAALGRGCGPLVVTRKGVANRDRLQSGAKIAIPGHWTTANLLLGLYLEGAASCIDMPYDRIMPSVAEGTVDAGVIIHESRFTYSDHGLAAVVDLGQWWETTMDLPIPLGGIAIRSDMAPEVGRNLTTGIAASIAYGRSHPDVSLPYIKAHAQEMNEEVIAQHINLYVNDFSVSLGESGRLAVQTLLDQGRAAGLLPATDAELFFA